MMHTVVMRRKTLRRVVDNVTTRCTRFMTLIEAILSMMDGYVYRDSPLYGVSEINIINRNTVRVTFRDKIDCNILSSIALGEGYTVDSGSYKPRVMDRGTIIIRVGSRSDKGGDRSLFVYLIPPSIDSMNMYDKCIASMQGILDMDGNRIDLERFINYNLRILKVVERYWEYRYGYMKGNRI